MLAFAVRSETTRLFDTPTSAVVSPLSFHVPLQLTCVASTRVHSSSIVHGVAFSASEPLLTIAVPANHSLIVLLFAFAAVLPKARTRTPEPLADMEFSGRE